MRIHSFFKVIISIGLCISIGFSSAIITTYFDGLRYMQLHLPIWQPPPYYFAPIWSLLYILMGISLAIIWIKNLPFKTKKTIYILFVIQLVFNFMWAILFFKYHLIVIALVDILLLINTLFMMMFFLSKISKVAAWLLLPYLAWVAFATYLNITIWILN